ncbi:heat shock protein sti1 homolog isoform X2 [Lytechinus variegatus]|uniref:heat shock protein sti1 homolog isoform X2 n=1 Tax=Lytechinus variegatus TaxID=7654 RepID=UPI001BB2BDC3|nr:heat shock protein sti1 homolog isoform X2 [Lytechinus variegatus]
MEKIRDRRKRGKKSSSETQDDVSTTSRESNNSSNSNSNTSLPSIAATSTTSALNIPTSTMAAANVRLPISDKRALFQEKVRQSNEACQNADFQRAIRLYTEALDLDPANHILYSNRSAAHVKLKDYERALTDAIKARELNPKWPKGSHFSCKLLFSQQALCNKLSAWQEGRRAHFHTSSI